MNIKLTEEEVQILLSILEQVGIQGTEAMRKVADISDKLKKAAEKESATS